MRQAVNEGPSASIRRHAASPIVAIDARLVTMPLESPIITRNYAINRIENVLLRLQDADGVVGYSYLWCITVPQSKILLEMVRGLTQFVLGKSPDQLGEILADMKRDINFLGFKGVAVFGYSAYEMALYDILCRRLDVSLSRYRGRRMDSLPVYWSGLMLSQTLDDLARESQLFADRGFRAFKLRVGTSTPAGDDERLRTVLANVPEGTQVMLDAVQCWAPDEAIRAANRFAKYEPRWLEEPVVHNDYKGLAKVVANSPVPIAHGENEYMREGFDQLFDTGLSYVVVDVERVGGVREWEAVAAIASVRGVTITPHVYPQISTQLCASMPQNELWVEYMPWWDALVSYPMEVKDGRVKVPDVPGNGFDPVLDAVDHYASTPWISLARQE